MGCRNIPVKRAVRKRLYQVVGQRVDEAVEVDPDMNLDDAVEVDLDMDLDVADPDMNLGDAVEVDPDMDLDALINQS